MLEPGQNDQLSAHIDWVRGSEPSEKCRGRNEIIIRYCDFLI